MPLHFLCSSLLLLDTVPATAAATKVTALVAPDTTPAAAANVTAVATGVAPTTASTVYLLLLLPIYYIFSCSL